MKEIDLDLEAMREKMREKWEIKKDGNVISFTYIGPITEGVKKFLKESEGRIKRKEEKIKEIKELYEKNPEMFNGPGIIRIK